jgi:2'-5' RNA ligase
MALWPAPQAAKCLAQLTSVLHKACGGRRIPEANQHVTVVFLGDVDTARIGDLQQVMQSAAGASFELQLDQVEYRRRGGMLWARATQVPAPLHALVERLRAGLTGIGFEPERRVFVPHVMLLRDARRPAQCPLPERISWRAEELTLVRSNQDAKGVRYQIVLGVALCT